MEQIFKELISRPHYISISMYKDPDQISTILPLPVKPIIRKQLGERSLDKMYIKMYI